MNSKNHTFGRVSQEKISTNEKISALLKEASGINTRYSCIGGKRQDIYKNKIIKEQIEQEAKLLIEEEKSDVEIAAYKKRHDELLPGLLERYNCREYEGLIKLIKHPKRKHEIKDKEVEELLEINHFLRYAQEKRLSYLRSKIAPGKISQFLLFQEDILRGLEEDRLWIERRLNHKEGFEDRAEINYHTLYKLISMLIEQIKRTIKKIRRGINAENAWIRLRRNIGQLLPRCDFRLKSTINKTSGQLETDDRTTTRYMNEAIKYLSKCSHYLEVYQNTGYAGHPWCMRLKDEVKKDYVRYIWREKIKNDNLQVGHVYLRKCLLYIKGVFRDIKNYICPTCHGVNKVIHIILERIAALKAAFGPPDDKRVELCPCS